MWRGGLDLLPWHWVVVADLRCLKGVGDVWVGRLGCEVTLLELFVSCEVLVLGFEICTIEVDSLPCTL